LYFSIEIFPTLNQENYSILKVEKLYLTDILANVLSDKVNATHF